MSSATYAFVFTGETDWKQSIPDDWELSVVEVSGTEKILGHKKIDDAICKILLLEDGKIIAIAK